MYCWKEATRNSCKVRHETSKWQEGQVGIEILISALRPHKQESVDDLGNVACAIASRRESLNSNSVAAESMISWLLFHMDEMNHEAAVRGRISRAPVIKQNVASRQSCEASIDQRLAQHGCRWLLDPPC